MKRKIKSSGNRTEKAGKAGKRKRKGRKVQNIKKNANYYDHHKDTNPRTQELRVQ